MTTYNNLALFDLDHTLLPLDSDYQWAEFLADTGRAGDPELARKRNDELMQQYNQGTLTAEAAANFMLGLLKLGNKAELQQWHAEYMRSIIMPAMTTAARELVNQHLNNGDLCAIVTATNSFVTAPIATAFGFDHLIATIPEQDSRQNFTGRISGTPSFKAGKVIRVREWLDTLGLQLEQFDKSWFYSDSMNDLPLMEVVTDPVAANPSPALRETALARNWQIIDLFDKLQDVKS